MFNRLTYGFWGTPHFRRNLPTWKSDAVTSNDRPFTISQQIPNNPPRQKNTQSAVATRLPDRRNCHCCATSFHYTDWLIKIRSLSLYMNIYISLSLEMLWINSKSCLSPHLPSPRSVKKKTWHKPYNINKKWCPPNMFGPSMGYLSWDIFHITSPTRHPLTNHPPTNVVLVSDSTSGGASVSGFCGSW